MQPDREAHDKKTKAQAQESRPETVQSEANITAPHIGSEMDEKIEEEFNGENKSDKILRPVQLMESEPSIPPIKAENYYTAEEQNAASDEDTREPLQKPSLIVTLSCPEIARFVTEDSDSDEELAEQDMNGDGESEDKRPEPLSEAQLAYFYAHFVDMDW